MPFVCVRLDSMHIDRTLVEQLQRSRYFSSLESSLMWTLLQDGSFDQDNMQIKLIAAMSNP